MPRLAVAQADIGLVDEGRRLEAVPYTLARHAASRDGMELLVDERDQLLEGVLVALSPSEQQSGDSRVVVSNPGILGPFTLLVTGSRFLDRRSHDDEENARHSLGTIICDEPSDG
jgi:hypothetical protein